MKEMLMRIIPSLQLIRYTQKRVDRGDSGTRGKQFAKQTDFSVISASAGIILFATSLEGMEVEEFLS